MRNKRKRIWIDQFQTYLAARLAVYFLLYQLAICAVYFIDARLGTLGGAVGGSSTSFGSLLTPVLALGLGLVFIYDAAKVTHRVVGPLHRVRKTIQAVTAGGDVALVGLRNGDYLHELRDDLNEMLRALDQRGAITLSEPAAKPEPVAV